MSSKETLDIGTLYTTSLSSVLEIPVSTDIQDRMMTNLTASLSEVKDNNEELLKKKDLILEQHKKLNSRIESLNKMVEESEFGTLDDNQKKRWNRVN